MWLRWQLLHLVTARTLVAAQLLLMQMPFQPRPHWIAFGFRTPFAHRAAQTRPRPWQQLAATMAAQQQPAQLASIFRRGSKQEVPGGPASSGDDPDALEQQLAQLAVAWAAPKAS